MAENYEIEKAVKDERERVIDIAMAAFKVDETDPDVLARFEMNLRYFSETSP